MCEADRLTSRHHALTFRPGMGKLPVPGRPTIWMIVGQGPIALAVGAGGGLFGHFYSPLYLLSSFSLSLGDSPCRLKYCLKGPLSPNETIVQTVLVALFPVNV